MISECTKVVLYYVLSSVNTLSTTSRTQILGEWVLTDPLLMANFVRYELQSTIDVALCTIMIV